MDLPAAIDVAIGLVVLYFLLSTVCSFAVELVAARLWWRKRLLYATISRLVTGQSAGPAPAPPKFPFFGRRAKPEKPDGRLSDAKPSDGGIVARFWEHPLARSLAPERQIPSYVEPSTFAAIVVDLAVPGASTGAVPATADGIEQVIELGAKSGDLALRTLRREILRIYRLRDVRLLADRPWAEPLAELRMCIEKWYNEAMDRLTGQYKRQAQKALLVIGFVAAALMNADTIRAVYVLGSNDALRATVATYGATLAASVAHQLKQLQGLQQMSFPLGWNGEAFTSEWRRLNFAPYNDSRGWLVLLLKLVGLSATALAVSLGAPFWFDLLNRLVSLRSSGKRIPSSGTSTEAGKSAAAGQRPASSGAASSSPVAPATAEAPPPGDLIKDLSDGRLGFTLRKGYWSAEAALLAYGSQQTVRSAVQQWSLEVALIFEQVEAAQGFLAVDANKKVALLAFRGTEKKLDDWRTDTAFELVKSPTGTGQTHKGFTNELQTAYNGIATELKEVMGDDTLLYLVGHSLGAGLATLLAARLVKEKVCGVHAVYTFGSPRVGDLEFAKDYEATLGHCTYRVVNGEDLVTRVPPRSLKYEHVGQVVYFDSDGRLQLNVRFWERFLNTVINAVQDFRGAIQASVKDHSMEGYVRLIKRQAVVEV